MKTADVSASNAIADANGAFTIAATGKAFRILSDGLYSDKITAVIRELSCNAYDSHVASGKPDTPFEIHLPSDDEQWFSVTDFGTGISDADITNIYTRYFASTKTSSNDFVGQLGLGSKSPFSLVREFEVKSRYDGIERTYRMYFDATDTPRVEFLYEGPAAVNGLTVRFPVTSYTDRRRFAERADAVLGWFKTTPVTTGNVIKVNKVVDRMTADGWFIRGRQNYGYNGPIALMGNVAYPIDSESIEGIDEVTSAMLELPLVIQFNIGDLEVSASRENLGYDKRTIANLLSRCTSVLDDIRKHYAGQIAACGTEWEARVKHDTLLGYDAPHTWQLKKIFSDYEILWNGVKIDSHNKKVNLRPFYDANVGGYRAHFGHTGKSVLSRIPNDDLDKHNQACTAKNAVVFNNVERGGLGRIKHWLKNESVDLRITVYDRPDHGSWDSLRAELGHPEVRWSESMPVPPRKASAGRSSMMEYKGSSCNKHSWENVDLDMDEGGYWIDAWNKSPVSPNGISVDLGNMLKDAVAAGIIPANTKVYAPKGAMKNKIRKLDDWINIVDMVREDVSKKISAESNNVIATAYAWEDVAYRNRRLLSHDWNLRDKTGLMCQFVSFAKQMSAQIANTSLDRYKRINRVASYVGIKVDNGQADPRINEMLEAIRHRYSMLFAINDTAWGGKMVNDYVDMVDQNYVWYALSEPENETEDAA